MHRLKDQESSKKKVKNIALNTSTKKSDETEEEVTKSSDNENLNLLVKRFGNYLKRKGNKGNQKRYNYECSDSNKTLFLQLWKARTYNVQALTKKKRKL